MHRIILIKQRVKFIDEIIIIRWRNFTLAMSWHILHYILCIGIVSIHVITFNPFMLRVHIIVVILVIASVAAIYTIALPIITVRFANLCNRFDIDDMRYIRHYDRIVHI